MINETFASLDVNETTTEDGEWIKKELMPIIIGVQLLYVPLLCVLGALGNALSVFVFFSTKLRKLSSSYYLSALAISDTGVLLPIFLTWLELVDIELFNSTSIVCKTSVYLSHMCSFLSVWFVVTFTVERFIAVRYPLQRPSVCTVARARCVLTVLTLISALLHSPYMWMANIIEAPDKEAANNQTKLICDLPVEWTDMATTLNHVDLFVTFLIPFTLIVLLNTLISRTVCKLARTRRSMTQNKHNGSRRHRNRPNSSSSGATSSSSSQTKVTEMLLIVSTVFICLNLPSHVFRVWVYVDENIQGSQKRIVVISQQIALLLHHTNFGINFALYCVSGQNFRRALTSMFCPGSRRRRTDTTTITVLSEYTRSMINHGERNNTTSNANKRKNLLANGNGAVEDYTLTTGLRPDDETTKCNIKFNEQDEWENTNDC